MLFFLLGIMVGLLLALVITVILAFFRLGIERKIKLIQGRLEQAGPKPRGEIFIPDSEETIARKEIIEKNKKEGKETRFEELL